MSFLTRTLESLPLGTAEALTAEAVAAASRLGVSVCVVVLDEAGRFLSGQCMDGATNAAFEVAFAKARHAANFRRRTSFQERLLVSENILQVLAVPGMLPLAGGVPVECRGTVVGAIGISGAASTEDEKIADAAIAAVALEAPKDR